MNFNQEATAVDNLAQRGFTLIELMTAIIVLAILAAVAFPSFRSLIVGQRVKTASFDIMSSLTLARSEAIKRNTNVALMPSNASWLNGWTIAAGASILKQQEALGDGLAVTCYSGAIASPCSTITYTSRGRLPAGAAALAIQINTNEAGGGFGTRCISLDPSGRAISKQSNCL